MLFGSASILPLQPVLLEWGSQKATPFLWLGMCVISAEEPRESMSSLPEEHRARRFRRRMVLPTACFYFASMEHVD